jgi:uncharacterized protein YqhQ
MSKKNKSKYTSIGGSALIEGVMMRGNDKMAIAVRKANGNIQLNVQKTETPKSFFFKIPILRGILGFITSMITSYKALMYSADVSIEDIEEEEDTKLSEGFGKVITIISMVLGIGLGVVIFMYLPTLLADLFSKYVLELSPAVKRIVVGAFKMLIFMGYMLAVSQMKDMRRVFEYHGAEHKTIFCFEAKGVLTPENAKKFKRFHPRCGTSFIVITLLVSIVASLFIPWKNAFLHSLLKILFLPLVMGVAYEFIKLAGKYDNLFTRIISAPGLWFQRITTKEPDEKQLEIAIWALKGVLLDLPLNCTLTIDSEGRIWRRKDADEKSENQEDGQDGVTEDAVQEDVLLENHTDETDE